MLPPSPTASTVVTLPARLHLSRVTKTFVPKYGPRVTALAGIDLEIESGEIIAIVGASGCGKSTLLRIIAGLERDYEGEVRVAGRVVAGPGIDRGMVFQEHRLLPWLDVAQNVEFGLLALAPAVRRASVAEHLALVGLSGFEHAYPHQLSGGMAQRAALARALAPRPGVLLLDEPFAALDALTKIQMQEELLRIRDAEKPTLVLVTHDIEEALFLADRVILLSERPGRIRAAVTPDLPHPRDRTSEAFSALRRGVLELFSARSAEDDFRFGAAVQALQEDHS